VVVDQATSSELLRRPLATTSSIAAAGFDDAGDTVIVDMQSGGTFTLPGGIQVSGGTGDPDELAYINPDGNSEYMLRDTVLSAPEIQVTHGGVEQFRITDLGGNDTYRFVTVEKKIRLEDAAGTDAIDFHGATAGVTLRLDVVTEQTIGGGGNVMTLDGQFENVYGTRFKDVFFGNAVANIIRGRRGDDVIVAKEGDDLVHAGSGQDTVFGGQGADTLHGRRGDDELRGGEDNDFLVGGGGDDQIKGGAGDDFIRGRRGSDHLDGGEGNDILLADGGLDILVGDTGRDLVIGGGGRDDVFGGEDEDILIGGRTEHGEGKAALQAILAEWTQATPIDDRIDHLNGTVGGGLNGSVLLDGSVLDDVRLDLLQGGLQADWLFKCPNDAHAPGEPTAEDRVTNV
jgi:Ca2+-binding RTX toxin-like protein